MATAHASEVCFKCKAKPGNMPLSCDKHFVCRDCLLELVNTGINPTPVGREVFKCPACQGGNHGSITRTVTRSDSTQSHIVSKTRSYKEALTSEPHSATLATPQLHTAVSASSRETDQPGTLPGIWIFVHQSNMWIEAKKLYSKQKGFMTDQDHRVRIDMGKLADVLGRDREEVKGKLYGSEPPPVDTVWKRIRERGWEVITSQRSQVTGKEKQVDTKLVTDVISLACKTPVHERTTMILVTGDANMIPAIEGVVNEERWKVEVYMWGNAISYQLRRFANQHSDRVKVSDLDQYLEKVTFTNMKFKISNPSVRSMVCAFGIVFTMEKGAFSPSRVPTNEWIDNLDSLALWPSQYYWFNHKSSPKNDLVVVFRPISGKRFEVKKFLQDVQDSSESSKTKYRLPLVTGVQTFIQFIGALAREARQDPAVKQFDAALEQVGIYSHDDACAGYENEAACVSDSQNPETWKIFRKKHRPQSRQRYTEECPKHYNCFYGSRCYYGHSDEEMAYFKKRKDGRGNPQRKVTLCKDFVNKRCLKKADECDWAHGDEDAWCKECRKTGHLSSKCPHSLPPEHAELYNTV